MAESTKIFAYGSLMDNASLRGIVPRATNLYPAKIYGFRRIFNLASHYRYCPEKQSPVCVLNLERSEPDCVLNGICFEIDQSAFPALMNREQIYQMHEVTVHRYNDDGPHLLASLFWAKDHECFRYLTGSNAQKHYLNICMSGCEAFGPRFLEDFKQTTVFWGIDSKEETDRIWRGNW